MSAVSETLRRLCFGASDAIPPGEGRTFCVEGHAIAVFRKRDGAVYAVQSHCPHEGGPLADGVIGGHTVICPLHAWKFDLETGACLNDPSHRLRVYPVQDNGGRLIVTLGGSDGTP